MGRRRRAVLLGLGLLLVAPPAGAATLAFTGTLGLRIGILPAASLVGAGVAQVSDDGSLHLLSLSLPGGSFGPVSTSIPLTAAEAQSLRFTGIQNLGGVFSNVSGGPPGGGVMPLQGMARICLPFDFSCQSIALILPLTATGTPLRGFGVGGTQNAPGAVSFTLQHAPWTVGQPLLSIHNPATTITTPMLPGGFAHGPASGTSSTAQASGALQLVTVTRVFTSLTGAFPELSLTGVLMLHFVPEPGTLLLLGSAAAAFALAGRRRRRP